MTGLTALNPFSLSLLPLAALPLLFHLFFRLKRQPRGFPTLMFFHRIDPKLNARRRLREWLILLLRTLLILFLLLALAHPVWFGFGNAGTVAVVLVIDNSGSMSGTGPESQPRLKQAINAARALLLQLRPQDSAAIVPLVDDPTVHFPAGLTSDKAVLKSTLDQLSETEASGSVARAIERATALLEGSVAGHFEIHVLSDLQAEKWNQAPVDLRPPPRGTSMVVHRIPVRENLANVSLAGVTVAVKSILSGRRLPVEVRLVNPMAVEGRVRLNWLDDAGREGNEEFTVAPQADKTAELRLEPPNAGFRWVNFHIEGDDFSADNRASFAFFCEEKKQVLFVGSVGEFGQLPLAVSPGSEVNSSGLVARFTEPAGLADSLRDQPAGLIVLTWETFTRPGAAAAARASVLKQFLDSGGTVLVAPSATPGIIGSRPDWVALAPESVQNAPGGLVLTVLAKADAMFNDLRDEQGEVALRNVRAVKFHPLLTAATNTPILGLENGRVVLAEQRIGKGRLLASGLAFDSHWSSLTLKPGFVALAQNLALADNRPATNIVSLVAGEPLLTGETAALRVQSLTGSPLDWKGEPAQLPTLPRAGVYALRRDRETTYVAVRSSVKEGRQKFLTSDTLPALGRLAYAVNDLTGSESLVSEFRRLEKSLDLSLPLLLLALASVVWEGWLANPAPFRASRSLSATGPLRPIIGSSPSSRR
jgi:hypothetical protein